jgi:hypothetical protein
MSKIESDKPRYQDLVDEIAAMLDGKDSGVALTALTVLLGNAGYFHEMDFEEFIAYVERNTYLVYKDQKEAEELFVLH